MNTGSPKAPNMSLQSVRTVLWRHCLLTVLLELLTVLHHRLLNHLLRLLEDLHVRVLRLHHLLLLHYPRQLSLTTRIHLRHHWHLLNDLTVLVDHLLLWILLHHRLHRRHL